MSVRLAVDNTRRKRASAPPPEPPDPVAQPYGAIDAVLTPARRLMRRVLLVLVGCAATAAAVFAIFF